MSAEKEARPLVKEEDEEDDEEENVPLSVSVAKKTPKKEPNAEAHGVNQVISSSKPTKPVKKEPKREVNDYEDDRVPIAHAKPKNKLLKKNKVANNKRSTNGAGRVRKAYDLPGQKHDPPEERDPLRIFYETLYQQVPTSDMAATWLMEWGLLPAEKAAAVFEKRRNLQQKLRSPVKATTVQKTVKASVKEVKKEKPAKDNSTMNKKAKKRKVGDDVSEENDDDDYMPLKNVKKQRITG